VVGGQCQGPATLPPRKALVLRTKEAGWAPGPVWTGFERKQPPAPTRVENLSNLQQFSIITAPSQPLFKE